MPITTNDDKLKIFQIISNDEYIQNLGFSKSDIERTRTTTEKINANLSQIFIYPVTPENTMSNIVQRVIYQIDISTPERLFYNADLCAEQIIALLGDTQLSKRHKIKLLDSPLIQTSPASNYCIGLRFSVDSTVFNKKKI